MKRRRSFEHTLDKEFDLKSHIKPKKSSLNVREAGTDENSKLEKIKDLGVPKFLVNKWLNIQNGKSKFVQKSCQIDNSADVSMTSEYTASNKSIAPPQILEEKQRRKSKFMSSFDIPNDKESDE